MSCDCPICPLVANNIQVCDVVVTYFPKHKKATIKNNLSKALSDLLSNNFVALVLEQARACKKGGQTLEVGKSYTWEQPTYEYTFYILKKDQYKVCFHCKTIEDEDPI